MKMRYCTIIDLTKPKTRKNNKAIAPELTAKGFNLILFGKDSEKLNNVFHEVLTINQILDIRSIIHNSSPYPIVIISA